MLNCKEFMADHSKQGYERTDNLCEQVNDWLALQDDIKVVNIETIIDHRMYGQTAVGNLIRVWYLK